MIKTSDFEQDVSEIAFRCEPIPGIVIWDVPRAASLSLVYGLFQTVSRHYKSGSAEREPRRTHAYDLTQVS